MIGHLSGRNRLAPYVGSHMQLGQPFTMQHWPSIWQKYADCLGGCSVAAAVWHVTGPQVGIERNILECKTLCCCVACAGVQAESGCEANVLQSSFVQLT